MDSDIIVRPPAHTDIEALALLHVSTWRETYSELLPASFFADEALAGRRRMWTEWIQEERSRRTVRVAEIEGEVVGFAAAGAPLSHPAPRTLELYMLYLAKHWHGSGAGQMMMDAVIAIHPAFLWVAEQNVRARAFYARNGFVKDGAEKMDAHAPGVTAIRLVR
jgi:ribosomal protein S18 acetylase RimI-like enzyme